MQISALRTSPGEQLSPEESRALPKRELIKAPPPPGVAEPAMPIRLCPARSHSVNETCSLVTEAAGKLQNSSLSWR